jgi:integrase
MRSKKLPSGSYRVQKQINGQRISMTFDHKPTKKEIEDEIARRMGFYNGKLTFEAAASNYIDARTNILSPSTIRGYRQLLNCYSQPFMYKALDDITNNDIQREINRFAGTVSAKTVKNRYTFISSVFAEFRPDVTLRVNLPMMVRKEPYVPNSEEIRMLISEAEGTQYKTALLLGCCGLRRGEICALTMDDIDFENHIVHVNKDIVESDKREWIVKAPKTIQSIRDVIVPEAVIESIRQNGLYRKNPHSITTWMHLKQDKLGIPHFSLHKLRHYFVSSAHEKGLSDASIMQAGGWAGPNVMIKHYRHAQNSDAVTSAVLEDII